MEESVQAGENELAQVREKAAEAAKLWEKIDILRLLKAIVEMMRVYGDFAKKIGEIQIDSPEAFQALKYMGEIAPEVMKTLADKSPPAEFGMFIRASLSLFEIAPKLEKMMELSGREKIEIGEKLAEIANALLQMVKKIESEEQA